MIWLCRLSTLKTADSIIMMENGLVAERGTFDELKRDGTRFNHLVRSQFLGQVNTNISLDEIAAATATPSTA